ncbi:SRPBCC family protein [Dyella flava]|uniref:SRPBCC family protein n=1 Tax=Dyella flava TaxID=1920170 RepID=A0ABS2JXT7_9GAMM|nr:SRPBCC family protein [Dyella flava]MBM7123813.1 SRPBCC family protein [Dyella flava]GLQ52693.1 ATPase [Dyella flava]
MNDYGTVTEPTSIRFERLLPGPIERVWDYLTDSTKRGQWFSSGPIEPWVGGKIEHIFNNGKLSKHDDPPPEKYARHSGEVRMSGRVLAYEPPHVLAYTFGSVEGGDAESEVRFELTPHGDQVLLVLTHTRLASYDALISVAGGWHTHLGILADRLNGREPPAFWKTHSRMEAEYEARLPRPG